jgi:hypothetical protein
VSKINELANTIANGFIQSFRDFSQRVHVLAENLSEEQFWTRPYSYGNSFGHLTLHIVGNLNHFVGAQIVRTGYVRDREREFRESARPAKEDVLQRLDETVALVISALEAQTAETWVSKYEAVDAPDFVKDRFSMFLRCASHFHHHLGQMIYLEKEFSTGVINQKW